MVIVVVVVLLAVLAWYVGRRAHVFGTEFLVTDAVDFSAVLIDSPAFHA
ncbi:MAG TPA: hypothetical protein VGI12_22475 [Vicinamibacterales bacterium]